MKSIILFLVIALSSFPLFAQSIDTGANSDSASSSGAASQSGSSLTFNSEAIRQSPGVGAPSLGVSYASDLCIGAVSSGLSVPGGALAFGKSVTDENCNARRDLERTMQMAGTFQSAGDAVTAAALRQAAVNIMCGQSIERYNQLVLAGVNCQALPGGKAANPDRLTLEEYNAALARRK